MCVPMGSKAEEAGLMPGDRLEVSWVGVEFLFFDWETLR